MNINFTKLQNSHFPLLLKWLEAPHVKAWWDEDIVWNPELIEQKYNTYIQGYKIEHGISKPIHAYIITVDEVKVGYIQYYNAYDFERDEPLINLPASLAAFDIFIGDHNHVGKGIGSKVLRQFCDEYIFAEFDHCLADPDVGNIGAIHAYAKAGFNEIYRTNKVIMMVR